MATIDRGDPLAGLTVLALGSGVPTRVAASWLAEAGADVASYRPDWQTPPQGSAEAAFEQQTARRTRPARFDEDSSYAAVLGTADALRALRDDVPGTLLESAVTVEITSPGPEPTSFDDALTSDMELYARSGLGYLTRNVDSDWELGEPCLPINRQASILAGVAAATAAVTALLADPATSNRPRRIAVDQLELLALMPMQPVAFAQLDNRIVGRERGPAGPGGTMPTANGMAYVRPVEPGHWAVLLRLIGELDWAAEAVESNPAILRDRRDEIDARMRAWASTLTSEEISDRCQAKHIPVAPVYRPDQVARDPHLNARGFFRRGDGEGSTGLNLPWLAELGDAGTEGEGVSDRQKQALLTFLQRSEAGHTTKKITLKRRQPSALKTRPGPGRAVDLQVRKRRTSGKRAKVAPTARRVSGENPASFSHALRPTDESTPALPLRGLRVLDLSWAWAGPFAATMLADLGAEVINVEWQPRASNLRRNAPFAGGNRDSNNTAAWWSANQRGKLSIGVNMKSDAGRDVVRQLAAASDVVVENFSPGVVDRLGVGYADLVKENPRLVYVSLSAFGQFGPRSHYIGYGTQLYAAGGAGYATSQDGRTMSQMYIPLPDPVSGLVGAFAMAAYVTNARSTGRPAHVDVSELEAIASVVLEPLLEALRDAPSRPATRRYVIVSPADGGYVALLSRRDSDWPDFARVLGAGEPNDAELQRAASELGTEELIATVRAADLAATPICDSAAVLADPYLDQRGFWVTDPSPEVLPSGISMAGAIWHVDDQRAPIWRGAPTLFGDTRVVLEELLAYSPDAVDSMLERGDVA